MSNKQNSAAIVHFYRATVMHADVWRRRLDVTTNWSVVTMAAIITFAFSERSHPHLSILLCYPFLWLFILMESRRYQMYDMWRYRVRLLNRFIVAPALSSEPIAEERVDLELTQMAEQLGDSIPRVKLICAVGYRIRRYYGLMMGAIFVIWLMKLFAHPTTTTSLEEVIARGSIGSIPGWAVLIAIVLQGMFAGYLGAIAPTERMRAWIEYPSPLEQFLRKERKTEGEELTLCTPEQLERWRKFEASKREEAREG